MTLVGFEPGTTGWQAKVLTITPKISTWYVVNKSKYLNLACKIGIFLVSAYSIVGSEKAHSGLLRTVFKTFGNEKLARLDSNHMWYTRVSLNPKTTALSN